VSAAGVGRGIGVPCLVVCNRSRGAAASPVIFFCGRVCFMVDLVCSDLGDLISI
jgi:hypothetical protein